MNHLKGFKLFVASVSVLWLFSIGTSAAEPLNVGIMDFRPYYVVDKEGNLAGEMYEVLIKSLEKAELAYTIKGFPAKRLYTQLSKGITEVFIGANDVPIYKNQMVFGKTKVTRVSLMIYGLPGTEMPQNITGLAGKKVLIISGFGYGGYKTKFLEDPRNNVQLLETVKHINAFKMLRAKRGGVEYLLNYLKPSTEALKSVDIPGVQSVPVFNIDTYFMVSNRRKNAQEILNKLETAFKELKAKGDI